MSDNMLSQEEIDALIRGASDSKEEVPPQVTVQTPSFPPLELPPTPTPAPPPAAQQQETPRRLEFLLEVPLNLTVELGRVRKLVKDVLTLGPGSILELDKLAGEPVDVLVNGRAVAKGEVVVIDENFGVRITEIKSPAERVSLR